jgi:triosephosphate isomerase
MSKQSFCIANWKMNKNVKESFDFLNKIGEKDLSVSNSKMIVCPSFISLVLASHENDNISFGSQNVSSFNEGSFTGEVSISMLEDIPCDWVIIGHSERRMIFNETNEDISNKMKLVYNSSLNPILCIGESLEEKNNDLTSQVLEKQIHLAFSKIDFSIAKDILIAYEPVWAIGTGIAADIDIIEKNMKLIKKMINNINTNNCNIYLLYGGSVNEDNAAEIFSLNDVNGFLIGGASLEVESFYSIYKQI